MAAAALVLSSCGNTSEKTTAGSEQDTACSEIKRESIEWLDIWAPHTNDTGLPRVLLLGHSITRLYGPSVDNRLEGKAFVTRLATSKSLGDPVYLDEVALILSQYDFDIIHVSNGAHGWDYTIEEYSAALGQLYARLKEMAPDAKLIWATNPPMADKEMYRITLERNESIRAFLAGKDIPIDDSFAVLDGKDEYYEGTDGVHPNAQGVEALAEVVSEMILESL